VSTTAPSIVSRREGSLKAKQESPPTGPRRSRAGSIQRERALHPPDHIYAGETRWVAVEASIVRDPQGAPVGLLGITRDITDRKRAEEPAHPER
jgi:PAS domain-containing protein